MAHTPRWRRYLRLFGPDTAADVDDELEFHLQSKVQELVEKGLTPEAARERSFEEFGSLNAVRKICQHIAGENARQRERKLYFAGWRQDIVYAIKQLKRGALSTTLALLTLASGIGLTTAIFSIVYGVVLKPLPFPNPNRIVTLWSTRDGIDDEVTPRNFDAWRKESRSFSNVSAMEPSTFTLTGGENPVQLPGGLVSSAFFAVFGAKPKLGRTFTPEEDRPGGARVVILSNRLWKTQFSADPNVIDRQIHLNAVSYTVIGVMDSPLDLKPGGEQLWTPLALSGQEMNWTGGVLEVVGQLRASTSLKQAQAEMNVIARELQIRYPEMNHDRGIRVGLFSADLVGDYSRRLFLLLGATGFVLAIACFDVANLLLARGAARQKEFAIRAAVGAARTRIVRQLLTESLVLGLTSAILGLGAAQLAIKAIVALAPATVPRIAEAQINPITLAFALLAACGSSVLFGIFPAWQASQSDVQAGLRQNGRASSGPVTGRLRNVFIGVQAALSVVLLLTADVFISAALGAEHTKPGFDPSKLLTVRTALPAAQYRDAAHIRNTYKRIADETQSVPGVLSVALTSKVPLASNTMGLAVKREAVSPPVERDLAADLRYVGPNYFSSLHVPLERGRDFSARDSADSTPVTIVNRTLARRLWPNGIQLGQTIRFPELERASPWQVVGIVGDVRDNGLLAEAPPTIYIPIDQVLTNPWHWTEQSLFLVVRTKANPALFLRPIRQAVHRIDPNLPFGDVATMDERLASSTNSARFYSSLMVLLGLIGLLLTIGGIYGVVAYFVTRQTQEIGIRIALGASNSRILSWIVRQGIQPVALGVTSGVLIWFSLMRWLSGQVYGISSGVPMTAPAVALTVMGVALFACYIPARKATRLDPMAAARAD
jgi:putative ABC transport system permease protein